ncbi:uncharacterized protein ACLA_007090 [Aspergillus clavatus NRRL 1]|uniref:Uncharacterized protein n=1 Tax=Aspergillus clavatus (strain ATCC 1007 / CBS 513.65 / DSM 816 / NCTC 3887 / NRRL 1 / QM 1276 / 107) TaxID=344612 RepID=A1CDM3_ASPCL|nr:uncharacterized protein ACLA_007090 [Aspergillus clavatus NRRL 1]EAW11950.1 conserved hypothetical protein [Aspergillus clavatus NRRL 1]
MSNALSFLKKLRRAQIEDLAEAAGFEESSEYSNKNALAEDLDKYLQDNRSILVDIPALKEYWARALATSPARFTSPVKRAVEVDVTPAPKRGRGTPAPKRATPASTRRALPEPQLKQEVEATTDDSDHSDEPTPNKPAPPVLAAVTPLQPTFSVQPPLPPSPAVVTDAIDQQTAVWRKNIHDAWTESGVQERSNALRSILSNVQAVETIVLAIEGFSIIKELVPLRFLTNVPAIEAIHSPEFPLKVPDLFMLVDGAFWAPFSLWLLTSLLLPLTVAYFFNISLHVAQSSGGPTHNTRRIRAAHASFDPLSFNIAKALISYLVYATRFTFWNVYSTFSIVKVNQSVPGRWPGLLTGAAIGTVGTLYEAILRK